MNKKITTILMTLLSLMFIATSCDESVQPGSEFTFPMQKGNSWSYDVYSLDGNNEATDEVISTRTITLGTMESLDDREAYPLENSNPPSGELELFTHISADEEGVYMYIGELDLNNFVDVQETKIPTLTIGWIKVFDFVSNEWEAFFLDYNGEVNGNKVKAKIEINGFNEGISPVNYNSNNYDATKVKINLNVETEVESEGSTISQTGVSDIRFEFIDGIGIYSLQQNINEALGIETGYKEVLTGHKH